MAPSALPTMAAVVTKPIAAASTKTRMSRLVTLAFGVTILVGAALGLYSFHSDVFQHSNALILRHLATATNGVHLSLSEKKSAGGTTYEGYLFPRTTESGDLTFNGRVSYIYRGNEFNFTLLDDRGYMTVADEATGALVLSRCLTTDEMPPVSTFAAALLDARVVDDVDSEFNISCSDGKLVEIELASEPFVFCSSATSNATAVIGADIEAIVEFLEENSEGTPSLASLAPTNLTISSCELLNSTSTSASVVSSARRLFAKTKQRVKDAVQIVRGEPRRSLTAQSDSCSCTNPKICLFVHGIGRKSGDVTTSDSDYWGDIDQDATCCSATYFMHLDTRNAAWYNDTLTSSFCETALSVSGGSDAQNIDGVAVVAHSMGNLIVASALQKGTCALSSGSQWIALSPPMYGSETATSMLDTWTSLSTSIQSYICGGDDSALSSSLYKAFAKMGLCGNLASLTSLAYDGSSWSTTELNALYAEATSVYASKVTNVMCGINSYGITSLDSAMMVVLDEFSGHASSDNDGIVEYASCRGGLSADQFDGDYDDGGGFYRANLNHRDTSFRNGNAVFGDSRKPVKWFNCQFN